MGNPPYDREQVNQSIYALGPSIVDQMRILHPAHHRVDAPYGFMILDPQVHAVNRNNALGLSNPLKEARAYLGARLVGHYVSPAATARSHGRPPLAGAMSLAAAVALMRYRNQLSDNTAGIFDREQGKTGWQSFLEVRPAPIIPTTFNGPAFIIVAGGWPQEDHVAATAIELMAHALDLAFGDRPPILR
ncbi:MAG TPA: hypothetical protein VMT30_06980 [Candidatus Saccharimonadia bacterium]|nr:hypothetical protein [Candidatus Saccharimonadia bacterium]